MWRSATARAASRSRPCKCGGACALAWRRRRFAGAARGWVNAGGSNAGGSNVAADNEARGLAQPLGALPERVEGGNDFALQLRQPVPGLRHAGNGNERRLARVLARGLAQGVGVAFRIEQVIGNLEGE